MKWRILTSAMAMSYVALLYFVGPTRVLDVGLLAGLGYMSYFLYAQADRASQDRRKYRHLIDPDSETPQHLVRVALTHNNVVYGKDVGAIMVIDDSLVFQGSTTHFSVSSEFACRSAIGKRLGTHSPTFQFEVEEKTYFTHVLSMSEVRLGEADPNEKKTLGLLDSWSRMSPAHNKLSVFPPITPAPDCLSYFNEQRLRSLIFAGSLVAMIAIPAAVDIVFRPNHLEQSATLVVVSALGIGVVLHAFRQASKTERKLESMRSTLGKNG